MPLGEPPGRSVLRRLPTWRLAGRVLHRVHRSGRSMWWFASAPRDAPNQGGRFDLPPPNGACYTATTSQAAMLEAFQRDFAGGLLPVSALASRRISSSTAPPSSPPAARLTAQRVLGQGVTAALWATPDRALTQRWAAELHGCGWQALYHGVQHDPTGRRRAVTLFDAAGAHAPWSGDGWTEPAESPLDTPATAAVLSAHGITVSTRLPTLPAD